MDFKDFNLYLPKYLSSDTVSDLFNELKVFPRNIDDRFYTRALSETKAIYQGDGINNLSMMQLPSPEIRTVPAMVLSNSCDADPSNQRLHSINIIYAPIYNLAKFEAILKTKHPQNIDKIEALIADIRKQRITNIFYLPAGANLENDSLVFLDQIVFCPANIIDTDKLSEIRLFTLSQYGFYVLLIKLSIHFTRVRESVDRDRPSFTPPSDDTPGCQASP